MNGEEDLGIKNFDAYLLDVVMRDKDFVIHYSEAPLKTPLGIELSHSNPRILQHILRELTFAKYIKTEINGYFLLSLQKDFIEAGIEPLLRNFPEILAADPFIKMKLKHSQNSPDRNIYKIMEFIENKRVPIYFMFSGISGTVKALNDFLFDNNQLESGYTIKSQESLFEFITDTYKSLQPEEKAANILLSAVHNSGILLPLLLIKNKISPSEYVNSLFSVNFSSENNHYNELSKFIYLNYNIHSNLPNWKSLANSFESIKKQANKALEYASYVVNISNNRFSVNDLISMGESYNLEFKSTLRWNIKSSKKDPAIEHACLKTIAAFLNSNGGTLLIGVRDDGSIEGIRKDNFDSEDYFSLHFWNLVKSSFGEHVSICIQTRFEKVADEDVFVVNCSKSAKPVFLNMKGFEEEFFIRTGPSSSRLGISEAYKYISEHFKE